MVHIRALVAGGLLALVPGLPAAAARPVRMPPPGVAGMVAAAAPVMGELTGVSVVSARDAWAAGFAGANNGLASKTVIVHWNGSAWSTVPSPSPGLGKNHSSTLNSVSADSATDAWAVGYTCGAQNCGEHDQSLILHWNGRAWSRVKALSPGRSDILRGVTALSPTNVWAVGRECLSNCRGAGPNVVTLILHWDGTAWSQVPSPSPSPPQGGLFSVSADSPTDVWAVGGPPTEALHWDGISWSLVPSPGTAVWFGVSAVSPTDALAVGTYCQPPNINGCHYTSIGMHWDGAAWSSDPTPNPRSVHRDLDGVSAVSPTDAWAVGSYLPNRGGYRTLIAHWNGTTWSRVSSPTPGLTPTSCPQYLPAPATTPGQWAPSLSRLVGPLKGCSCTGTARPGQRPQRTLDSIQPRFEPEYPAGKPPRLQATGRQAGRAHSGDDLLKAVARAIYVPHTRSFYGHWR
jgi:hypothetical protein